jgi:murein DD-endopeptidase MepM/ murein hydrolase activator NlpD
VNQPYFILEFAHSIHGHFKRIQVTHRFLKGLVCSVAILGLFVVALFSTCLWMGWKVSKYEKMRADLDHLRSRYQDLQRVSSQRGEQMKSLETLAEEVSAAYGLKPHESAASEGEALDSDTLDTSAKESIEQFNFLKSADYSALYHKYAYQWQAHSQPSAWPLTGILRSSFGERADPFSGEGAFHTGIDLSAVTGTPVHVTADGIVAKAGWGNRYGNLVIVNHGNGVQTYYAHLSQCLVVPGEEVRLGQEIALSGGTGRATSPHLHYEVRVAGIPVNPYRYLSKVQVATAAKPAHDDLGL